MLSKSSILIIWPFYFASSTQVFQTGPKITIEKKSDSITEKTFRSSDDQSCTITSPSWVNEYLITSTDWGTRYNCDFVNAADDDICRVETSRFCMSLNIGFDCEEVYTGSAQGFYNIIQGGLWVFS